MALMTCGSGQSMAETVAEHLGLSLLPTTETWFACGEGKIEIEANVRGHDVYIFQSMVENKTTKVSTIVSSCCCMPLRQRRSPTLSTSQR